MIVDSCLEWFHTHPQRIDTFICILGRQEGFSLRVVDWMVTNYSKFHRLVFLYRGSATDVHTDYHRYLNVFNKRYFDPFARRERIQLLVGDDATVLSTTVGQLNFMKWFLQRGLDDMARAKRADIEADMKNPSHRRAPHALANVDTSGSACVYQGPFSLTF